MNRVDLAPVSALPLAYFALAHASLGTAFALLAAQPDLPGGFYLHQRMVAIAHLVTLGWITGSILGAFYIVAPLALVMPMRPGRLDWAAGAVFALALSGVVSHFWIGEYEGMAWSAGLVLGTVAWVMVRATRGLRDARVPWPVKLHVHFAFGNIILAALLGTLLGLGRSRGLVVSGVSAFSAVYAHAHLAAVGWALMLVVGLAYRLLPMILPAKAPTGPALAASAVLMEAGLLSLAAGFLIHGAWLAPGAVAIAAGLAAFVRNVRRMLAHRLPRPPALPARDWSSWQVHTALLWLAIAVALGLRLAVAPAGPQQIAIAWIYGVAGLVGGLSQMVVGMQGRLVPLYAYYRAMAARGGTPPERSANALPSPRYARAVFVCWLAGLPALAFGLAAAQPIWIRAAALVLLAGVAIGAAYLRYLMRAARP